MQNDGEEFPIITDEKWYHSPGNSHHLCKQLHAYLWLPERNQELHQMTSQLIHTASEIHTCTKLLMNSYRPVNINHKGANTALIKDSNLPTILRETEFLTVKP